MKTFPIGGVHPSDNKLSRAVAVERFALPTKCGFRWHSISARRP